MELVIMVALVVGSSTVIGALQACYLKIYHQSG